jgi:hypothetical protein
MAAMPRRLATISGTAAALVAFIAPTPASAGVLQAGADTCPTLGPVTQHFSRYGDDADYQLVPGGDFADDHGWALDGAQTQDGALALGRGDSATSPAFCATVDHPTFRFFTRGGGGGDGGKVELLWTDDTGADRSRLVGLVGAGRSWSPTLPMELSSVLRLVSGDVTPVRLRISSFTRNLQVDNVYVDPARAR